jgi:hypothetical protein
MLAFVVNAATMGAAALAGFPIFPTLRADFVILRHGSYLPFL